MVKNGQKHHRESYYVINGVAKSRKENTFILPHGIKISQTSWSMFFFFDRYAHFIHTFTLSSFVLCVPHLSVTQMLLLSSRHPSLPRIYLSCLLSLPAITPFFTSSLIRSLTSSLLHTPAPQSISSPLKTSSIIFQWSNPRVSFSARNLTGRQTERKKERNEPRKDTADSSLRWAEVSCVLFKLKTERDQNQNICAITCNIPRRNTTSPEASVYVNLHIDKHGAKPWDVPSKKNNSFIIWSWTIPQCVIDNVLYHANRQTNRKATNPEACLPTSVKTDNKHPEVHFTGFLRYSASSHCFPIQGENNQIIRLFLNFSKPSRAFFQPNIPHTPTIQRQAAFGPGSGGPAHCSSRTCGR